MAARRPSAWLLLLAAVLGLTGCEPYMSTTDRVPAQTRQATSLLPETPHYAGMVDLEAVMEQIDGVGEMTLADSLSRTGSARLQTFLDATGMTPETDLKAVYGAAGDGSSLSAVVFADLTSDQMNRYVDHAPGEHAQVTTYRNVPVYRLRVDSWKREEAGATHTLSLALLGRGTVAAATDAEAVEAMVDRHHSATDGLGRNEPYMSLVEQVGHGTTAWLVGRDILQTAFRDSASSPSRPPEGTETGVQQFLSGWADRVLGVSDAPPVLDGSAGSKVEKLQSRIREQAVSLTLTDETLDAEAYLTMRDEESATNIVEVSKGAMAAVRLSNEETDGLMGDLLEGASIDRNGPVVHVELGVPREQLRKTMQMTRGQRAVRRAESSIHRSKQTIRRSAGILQDVSVLEGLPGEQTPPTLRAGRPVSSPVRDGDARTPDSRG
jgi:hypothetical protein